MSEAQENSKWTRNLDPEIIAFFGLTDDAQLQESLR